MKKKQNAGFSLIEVVIAIAILGVIVVPACSAMVMSFRMNAKTESMMQAQLAVSSAVEELMASGIASDQTYTFDDVVVSISTIEGKPYFEVTVSSADEAGNATDLVSVTTHIRKVPTDPSAGGGTS